MCFDHVMRVSLTDIFPIHVVREGLYVERDRSVVECRTRNQGNPGSNLPLLPFRSLGIFVLSMKPQFTQLYK